MPALLTKIAVWFVSYFLSNLIVKLLLGAGLAFLSFTFINDLVGEAQAKTQGVFANLPSDIIGILGIMQIPQGLSIIFSALGIAAFIKSSKLALGKST